MEIDTNFLGKAVHILGYHFASTNQRLLEALTWTRKGRVERIGKIIKKINQLGYALTMDDILIEAKLSKSLGRPHIARAMVKKGYFTLVQEVFDTLIASGKPAFCEQEKLSPEEAVALIHEAGGITSLAHPCEITLEGAVTKLLKETSLDAIEVWHPSAREGNSIQNLYALAKDRNLMMSGGSDFHGMAGRFPDDLGVFPVLYDDVKAVIEYRNT